MKTYKELYKELPKAYRDKIEKEVDDLFDKVDKEYAESIKICIAKPIYEYGDLDLIRDTLKDYGYSPTDITRVTKNSKIADYKLFRLKGGNEEFTGLFWSDDFAGLLSDYINKNFNKIYLPFKYYDCNDSNHIEVKHWNFGVVSSTADIDYYKEEFGEIVNRFKYYLKEKPIFRKSEYNSGNFYIFNIIIEFKNKEEHNNEF
jgi:hypothetical protein